MRLPQSGCKRGESRNSASRASFECGLVSLSLRCAEKGNALSQVHCCCFRVSDLSRDRPVLGLVSADRSMVGPEDVSCRCDLAWTGLYALYLGRVHLKKEEVSERER